MTKILVLFLEKNKVQYRCYTTLYFYRAALV